mgnify:CR=1 FL=1
MPQYLSPGVYVEEISSGSRAVESVATSTVGMVGATQYGPVPYPADVSFPVAGGGVVPARARLQGGPHLVRSLAEYERLYGGLPAFLTGAGASGVDSGMMVYQYTAAALASENKVLAHPASVDSIPTSANQEDHVSMGATAEIGRASCRERV